MAGTSGAAGSGGSLDGRGAGGEGERDGGLDSPLGGASGGSGGGGGEINGSGGVTGPGDTNGSGGVIVTGGTRASGGVTGTGGTGSGGTTVTCTGSQKLCNDTCISNTECCGGCSGNTPVCNNGTCVGNPNGTACTTAAAAACATGICADGVCCDVACTGQCEACNTASAKGTCSPTTNARTACTTDASYTMCGGTCDGTAAHRQACSYPSTQCVAGSCLSGTQTYPRMCDGAGHCGTPTPASRSCSPYTCADTTSCATGCSTGQDTCGGSTCVALNTDTHCGTCSNNCTTSSKHCSSGNACVQCTGDGHCSGTTPKCNTSTNTCVGCVGNGDCTSSAKPICNNNTCVQCTVPGDCSGDKTCTSNQCVCPSSMTDCSGVCINVYGSDNSNCGSCGNKCGANRTCSNGSCACTGYTLSAACGSTCGSWSFESGTGSTEGWSVMMSPTSAGQPSNGATNAVISSSRPSGYPGTGSYSLVVPLAISAAGTWVGKINVVICPGAAISVGGYTLTGYVYFDGPTFPDYAVFEAMTWAGTDSSTDAQTIIMSQAGSGTIGTRTWLQFSRTIQTGFLADRFALQVAPNGPWSGTMYLDDIKLTGL